MSEVSQSNTTTTTTKVAPAFTSEIVEDSSVPHPCIVTLPVGGYDLDHDADTDRRELYIHSPADARSVGEALLAVADTCGVRTFADDETHVCTREGDHDGPHRSAAGVEWQSEPLGERVSEVVAELLAGADDAVYAAIGRGMVAIRAESGDWLVNDLDVIAQAINVRVSTMLERLVRS